MIRNERTPKGDGNFQTMAVMVGSLPQIRNERTPKGDGNLVVKYTAKGPVIYNKK